MIEKKKWQKIFTTKSDKSIANQNSAWDKDNQAWWDWYVSLVITQIQTQMIIY